MENPNTPTPSGTPPGAASAGSGQTAAPSPIQMSTLNNRGYLLREVTESNTANPLGGSYLEVFETDEHGKPDGDPVVSCFVADCETSEEVVGHLLSEFLHPFGAAWDSPEEYGRQLDAVKWLAEFHGIKAEDVK
jgi:hypothetical protein